MPKLSKPFFDENNQAAFCGIGLFWVSTIGPLLTGNTTLSRLTIYPIYIVLLLPFALKLFHIKRESHLLPGPSRLLFSGLIVFSIICVSRGLLQPMDTNDIRAMLFSREGAIIIWLMPLAMLFSLSSRFWFSFLSYLQGIVLVGFFYVFTCMLVGFSSGTMLVHQMYNSSDLLFLAPLLIVIAVYKEHKRNIVLGIVAVGLLVVYMFFVDERFAIAFVGLICLFYLFLILRVQKKLHTKIFILVFSTGLIVTGLSLLSLTPYFQFQVQKYFVEGELLQDTRGEGSLANAVMQGTSTEEKLFGKGINGTYFYGNRGWPPQPYIRNLVEMGYMQTIFKGGYAMLLCFTALAIYATYLGLFRTNNKITKCLALMILARLIIMFTAMIPRIGFEYYMFWLAIGGCLSPEVRKLTDAIFLENLWNKKLKIKW
jgi:hypothetical protein